MSKFFLEAQIYGVERRLGCIKVVQDFNEKNVILCSTEI